MDWKDLAPWLALAVTLALSILVPLFTQIANNKFQLRMYKSKIEEEKKLEETKKVIDAYESFITNVGECVGRASNQVLNSAIAHIHKLYLYCPCEWWVELDSLCDFVRAYRWDDATKIYRDLVKKIAKELEKYKK